MSSPSSISTLVCSPNCIWSIIIPQSSLITCKCLRLGLGTVLDAEVAGVHSQKPPQLQSGNKLLSSCPGMERVIIWTDRLLLPAHCTKPPCIILLIRAASLEKFNQATYASPFGQLTWQWWWACTEPTTLDPLPVSSSAWKQLFKRRHSRIPTRIIICLFNAAGVSKNYLRMLIWIECYQMLPVDKSSSMQSVCPLVSCAIRHCLHQQRSQNMHITCGHSTPLGWANMTGGEGFQEFPRIHFGILRV